MWWRLSEPSPSRQTRRRGWPHSPGILRRVLSCDSGHSLAHQREGRVRSWIRRQKIQVRWRNITQCFQRESHQVPQEGESAHSSKSDVHGHQRSRVENSALEVESEVQDSDSELQRNIAPTVAKWKEQKKKWAILQQRFQATWVWRRRPTNWGSLTRRIITRVRQTCSRGGNSQKDFQWNQRNFHQCQFLWCRWGNCADSLCRTSGQCKETPRGCVHTQELREQVAESKPGQEEDPRGVGPNDREENRRTQNRKIISQAEGSWRWGRVLRTSRNQPRIARCA